MAGELTTVTLTIGIVAFAVGAIAYAGVAVLLLVAHRGTRQSNWLLAALIASALWCVAHVVIASRVGTLAAGLPLLDSLHALAWLLFLASLLLGRSSSRLAITLGRLIVVAALTLVIVVAGQLALSGAAALQPVAVHRGLLPVIALGLIGLLGLEQIYRNAADEQRPFLKWLVGGIGAVLVAYTFAYSQALLFAGLQPDLWITTGIVNLLAAPAILVAIKRQPDWGRDLYVSRQIVFYTTALTGAGLYLFAMGVGGFLLGTGEGPWSAPIQILFLALASAALVYGLYSSDVRRWFRVFVSKHFFRDRYDYRDEWLRLTRALAGERDEASLAERGLRALGDILSSPGGALWLEDAETRRFMATAHYGAEAELPDLAANDEMIDFLRRTQWVVDTSEYVADPGKYANSFDPDGPWAAQPAIIVPLVHCGAVIGLARLDRAAMLGSLNFKDHDLLKTAGQQVAVFLMQQRAQDALFESRQFEAYSKLTAFLMHDLKNMIAQQELVVGNARRFRDRPEFIDDAIQTIDASVKRMRRLLERFRSLTAPSQASRIELESLVRQVCNDCADREPVPHLEEGAALHVSMDRDKLAMCLTHAIRNAQDATSRTGRIALSLREQGGRAVVEIRDSGSGMDAAFVRDKLFRPFASTKGARGMGIGAYQMRETLQAAGGAVEVDSVVGQGTTFRFLLPLDYRRPEAGQQSVA